MFNVQIEILTLLRSENRWWRGLELIKKSEETKGKLKRGTVYVHLSKLEGEQLVESCVDTESNNTGLLKRLYRISSSGRRKLIDGDESSWIPQPGHLRPAVRD